MSIRGSVFGQLVLGFVTFLSSPSVAQEVVEIRAAAPTVVVVVVESGPHPSASSYSSPVDAQNGAWTIDGAVPADKHLYSVPWRQEFGSQDVVMQHRVFLETSQPLQSGQTYTVGTPYGDRAFRFSDRETFCESIKVNQVGYHPSATSRFANFGVYMGDGGSLRLTAPPTYRVIEEKTGAEVASGRAEAARNDTNIDGVTSGEHVYRLRLDNVPSGGPYHVVVDGCGRSRSFGIGLEYSRKIAKVMTRGLYHQRCGTALSKPYTEFTRAECHVHAGDTRRATGFPNSFISGAADAPQIEVRGGYHDAADYDRRPFHLIIPITLLSYYEAFPSHFVDSQYNIPESGNGIPDFLDEALWSLLGWENLQVTASTDADYGGVRAGTEMERHPTWGVSAASDTGAYGTWMVTREATALSAGFFAHASRLLKPYDSVRAAKLLWRAQRAWSYLEKNGGVDAAQSDLMYAALQLYLATGDESYHQRFRSSAARIVAGEGTWPEVYLAGNTSAKCSTSHFISYLLTDRPVDLDLGGALRSRIFTAANTGTYMGPPPEGEPYPQGVTRFLGWGAGTAQGRYADAYIFAWRLTNDPARRQLYFNAASQYADYALGLNPMGTSYVTGLGTDQPNSPLHLDSYYTRLGLSDGVTTDHVGAPKGDVPGTLVFGPTTGRSGVAYQRVVSDKLYPEWDALPQQRRWAHGWSLINGNEFTVWSTTLWGVVLHGFLYDASQDKGESGAGGGAAGASGGGSGGSGGSGAGGVGAGGTSADAGPAGSANPAGDTPDSSGPIQADATPGSGSDAPFAPSSVAGLMAGTRCGTASRGRGIGLLPLALIVGVGAWIRTRRRKRRLPPA